MLLSNPSSHLNWGGNAQNLLLTGAAWIVADFFARNHEPKQTVPQSL
jgi:hypothetical protein